MSRGLVRQKLKKDRCDDCPGKDAKPTEYDMDV